MNINAALIRDIAEDVHNENVSEIPLGLHGDNDEDFVLQYETSAFSNDVFYVGIRQDDGQYAVAAMAKGSETIGLNSPRYLTSKNKYVKVKLYHGPLSEEVSATPEFVESIRDDVDNGPLELKDKGSLYGYRVRKLDEMLEDVFIGYSPPKP